MIGIGMAIRLWLLLNKELIQVEGQLRLHAVILPQINEAGQL